MHGPNSHSRGDNSRGRRYEGMMFKHHPFLFFLFLFSFPHFAWADPPVVPGNGFSCVKSQLMVTCQGQFAGVPGSFSASGIYGVQLYYETPGIPRARYSFDSTTGCFMRTLFDNLGNPNQVLVRTAGGASQNFMLPLQQDQSVKFCRSSF